MKRRTIPASINAISSQALSSLRSLGFLIIAARQLPVDDFGVVAIVTTATIGLNEVLRAAASHPLALAFDDAPVSDDEPLSAAVSFHVLLATVIGLSGAVLLGILAAAGLNGAGTLAVGALMYASVAAADALRTGSINRGRADRSVVIDGCWSVVLLVAVLVALQISSTAVAVLLAWGLAAVVVAGGSMAGYRLRLSSLAARRYWTKARPVATPLTVQVGLESVPTRLAPLIIAGLAGASVAGSIRGAEVLLGGAAMIYSGVAAAALRHARSTFVEHSLTAAVRAVVGRFSVVLVVLAANVVAILALPDRIGRAILGASWQGAVDLAPVQAVLLAALVLFAVVSVIMRATLEMGQLVRLDAFGALAVLVSVPLATLAGGAEAGLSATAAAVGCMVVIGARQIHRSSVSESLM